MSATELERTFGALLDKVPRLQNRVGISELSGGLTNRNLKVLTSDNAYVARISSNESNLLSIDRAAEYKNSIIAADAGIGAPVYDYLPADVELMSHWMSVVISLALRKALNNYIQETPLFEILICSKFSATI